MQHGQIQILIPMKPGITIIYSSHKLIQIMRIKQLIGLTYWTAGSESAIVLKSIGINILIIIESCARLCVTGKHMRNGLI